MAKLIQKHVGLDDVLPRVHEGKVRITFEVPDHPHLLLQYATDGVSTHNVVHQSQIDFKGMVLTALTVHWLREVFDDIDHHLVAAGMEIYQYFSPIVRSDFPDLHHRAVVVRKLDMILVEFIYRRYLVRAGSLYKAYVCGEDPYGLELPRGLPIMYRFGKPIFTPTDKSERDDPLNAAEVEQKHFGESLLFGAYYGRAEQYLNKRGVALLDSKGEMGINHLGNPVLADELFTPDSSRFAYLDEVEKAVAKERDPPWLDKQLVRDEAERQWAGGPKTPLVFPDKIVRDTQVQYAILLELVTGKGLAAWTNGELFGYHV